MLVLDVQSEMKRASLRARSAILLSSISVVISLIALAVAVHYEAVRSAASQVAALSGQPAPRVRVPTKVEIKRAGPLERTEDGGVIRTS
jgi:hypothetical protein